MFLIKRPSMIPNYIIPSEYEMIEIISKTQDSSCLGFNAKNLIEENKINCCG
jgi:hypothetical protein